MKIPFEEFIAMFESSSCSQPTFYNGFWMRSKLEARWAAVMDSLELYYLYEIENFNTPNGRYLPDFHLPLWNLWLEIKPFRPTISELEKLKCVATKKNSYAILVSGFPYRLDSMRYQPKQTVWRGAEIWIIFPTGKIVRVDVHHFLDVLPRKWRTRVNCALSASGPESFTQTFHSVAQTVVLTPYGDWYRWNEKRNREKQRKAQKSIVTEA